MYNPSAFLISSAALTSIFSFFFGGYFKEREKAYLLWIRYVGYESILDHQEEAKHLCAELEAKERVFRQAKGVLKILLLTIVADFFVFQAYSFPFVFAGEPWFRQENWHTYKWYSIIIGFIVMVNCLEMLYIRIAVETSCRFPFIRFRHRVTGQDRIAELWELFGCCRLKDAELNRNRVPDMFYKRMEQKDGKD